jgi:DNA repair exonuclease SbcCD ATPase subunit
MKTKNLLCFTLFITITVLLSGCGKKDASLAAENASLKARVQKLEQQLKESNGRVASPGAPAAPSDDLKGQLDESQKRADAAAAELQSANSQLEAQKLKIDELTRQLTAAQQARVKAEQALKLYQDNTTAAIKQFLALRSTLGGQTASLDAYHQNYLATQTAVTKLVAPLPESKIRRSIMAVLATFSHANATWETTAVETQERAKVAQADYDKFVYAGGLGPNDYLRAMGQKKILAPAQQENAVAASKRDQQMVSFEKDIDVAIKNLQTLANGQGA